MMSVTKGGPTKDSSPRYETLADGGDFEDDELRLLGKLHVDQSKWLPEFSSPVVINAGTTMLHDVYFTHKDVVFYAELCMYMALVSICLMCASKEMQYQWMSKVKNPLWGTDPNDQLRYNIYQVSLFLQSAATLIQIFALYGYYRSSIRVEQINKRFMSHLKTLWLDQHLYPFLLEVALCIWHEPPWIQHWADISLNKNERGMGGSPQEAVLVLNPWALLAFVRVYLVVRWLQARTYSAGTRILGNWANFEFTTSFTLRDVLGSSPVVSLIVAGVFIILAGGFSFYVMEREIPGKPSYVGSIWWSAITAFAVGYGDIYPGTFGGRVIAIFTAGCGVMWVAAVTAAAYSNLVLFPYESRMVEFLEMEVCKKNKKHYGACVIQSAYRWYRVKRAGWWVRWKAKRRLVLHIDLFHHNAIKMRTFTSSFLESQFFRWSIEKLQGKVDEFMRRFTTVYHIEKRFEAEERARAAAEAARKLAAQLELKRQEAEAEARKTEADIAAEHRAREQKRAAQAEREAAAEAIVKQIALINAPKAVVVDPLAIMRVPPEAPVVRWRGAVSQAASFQGAGTGPFEVCSISDATAVLSVPHRPPSPIPAQKQPADGGPAPYVCKRCLVCYYCRREAENEHVQSVHQCLSCVDPALSPEPLTPRDMSLAVDGDAPADAASVGHGSLALPGQASVSPTNAGGMVLTGGGGGASELEMSTLGVRQPSSHQVAARAAEPSNSGKAPSNGVPLTTAQVIGDHDQDNFLVLPEPGVNARLERLLNTIQTHVTAINRNLTSLQQRVEKSEVSLAAAERQLRQKRALVS